MIVTVTREQAARARDEGTVIVLEGTEEESGDLVVFAGDRRPVFDALAAGLYDLEEAGHMAVDVDGWQVLSRVPLRLARVARSRAVDVETVAAYLPGNYSVSSADGEWVYVSGHDMPGWTLDGYVIPRLASGLVFAEEVKRDDG